MPATLCSRRELLAAVAACAASGAPPAPRQKFRGVFIIMQTPFLEDKQIDAESLAREADFLCRCKVHGMVWPAGAGETSTLTHDERLRYPEVLVKAARKRVPVVIGVHGATNQEAAEFARQAERAGADAILALGRTDGIENLDALTEYFTAITAASKLPLFIQVSTGAMTVDYLIGLAKKLPTFRYVKEEQAPVPKRVERYVKEARDLLVPMTGGGSRNLMNEMARGSEGTMPGAGFADIQAKIWDWYQEGKKKEARELFGKMLMMAVLEQQTGYVLQKEILRRRGIFRTIVMRNSRGMSMDAGDLRELDEIFAVLRPYFRA
ncbi:MAG TPA: dihydrodipicolinate synthase family protein [Bryobacteraceae bacterium]|nr:dihydrodipicolinate synthase family protein [Bryobacteraceae bacterium]